METTAIHRHSATRYGPLLVALIIGLVIGSTARDAIRVASAQVPNPYQQRLETNQGLEQLNASVAEVLTVLRSGTLKVRVVETDKTGSATRSSREQSEPAPLPPPNPSRGPVVSPGTARPAR